MARLGYALCFTAGVISCAIVTTSTLSPTSDDRDGAVSDSRALQQSERRFDEKPPSEDQQRHSAQVSHEMIERCLGIAEEIDTEMANRLRMFCTDDPANCHSNFMRVGSRLIELARLQDRDPELYGIKIQSLRQDMAVARKAEDLRTAIASDDIMMSSKLENELMLLVKTQLAMTIYERHMLLERFQSEVDRLKSEIESLGENFDESVAERMEQLKCGHDPVKPSWPTLDLQKDNATN